jgi:hypothetical protein
MNTKTIKIIFIVSVVLLSFDATMVLILWLPRPQAPFYIIPMPTEQGQITRVTFTVGSPNGTISAIFNDQGTTNITISTVYVNNMQQPTWICYVNGVATSPAVVPYNLNAQFNITTTVVAGSRYDIKLVSIKGDTFVYTGTAPT